MAYEQHKASAPGSVMLFGEHAVLQGAPAIVCAVAKRIHITLTPTDDKLIKISSPSLGEYQTPIDDLQIIDPWGFVLYPLKKYHEQLKQGCQIHITSEFSHKVGLGSSAAVTVAMCKVLQQWLEQDLDLLKVFNLARDCVYEKQGIASGADVAASTYGGILYYHGGTIETIRPIESQPPLYLNYCGYKTPTPEVIQQVKANGQAFPTIFAKLYETMGQCSLKAREAILLSNWPELGRLMYIHQQCQRALGCSDKVLDKLIAEVENKDKQHYFGAKISGAGLGDCIIVCANEYNHDDPAIIPVTISKQGVMEEVHG